MSGEAERAVRCPSWCERDEIYEPLTDIDPGAVEHTRLIGLSQGVLPRTGTDTMVSVQVLQYVGATGEVEPLKVQALSPDGEWGEWHDPAQLRQYAATLMAAADELEAAKNG